MINHLIADKQLSALVGSHQPKMFPAGYTLIQEIIVGNPHGIHATLFKSVPITSRKQFIADIKKVEKEPNLYSIDYNGKKVI